MHTLPHPSLQHSSKLASSMSMAEFSKPMSKPGLAIGDIQVRTIMPHLMSTHVHNQLPLSQGLVAPLAGFSLVRGLECAEPNRQMPRGGSPPPFILLHLRV